MTLSDESRWHESEAMFDFFVRMSYSASGIAAMRIGYYEPDYNII